MKKLLIFSFLTVVATSLNAQKHDYQWLYGYGNEASPPDTNFEGVIFNFNYAPPTVFRHPRIADFTGDNVSYCDDSGNLLLYSNGADIFDRRDSVMLNGDSINLNPEWIDEITYNYRYTGLVYTDALIALPAPGDSSKAYLCHYSENLVAFTNGYADYPCDSSYYSVIDLKGNSGYGAVIEKEKLINDDTLANGCFSAVQHGNGRDWWVLHPYWQGNNCYYQFLLNDTGMGLYNIQCLGKNRTVDGSGGQSCFSPDGSKYFWVSALDGIRMFDFDRCTGLLSNPQIIPFPSSSFAADMDYVVSGIAVSPSNQYLYVVGSYILLQYDLLADSIGASVDTVGVWDSTYDPAPPYATTFYLPQLGPDGKIYICSTNGIEYLHVINQPDLRGDSCMFAQHSLYLETENASCMPNFPNYRLGALTGSPCDSLSAMTEVTRSLKEEILKVFPNPAGDYTIIDYGFTDWNNGGVGLEICNELGQPVYQQQLPMYSGYQKIDLARFASGMYTAFIKRSSGVLATAQFVKE